MSPRVWLGVAAGAVVLVLLYGQWERRRGSEAEGKWKAIAQRLQSDSAALAGRARGTDSVFRTDTIRLRSVLNRYVTRRDTLRVSDTVAVREFIAVSDTAIRACTDALSTCTTRVAQRDTLLVIAGRQRAADARLHAAQLRRLSPRVTPYVEALVDPFDARTRIARGGVELRLFGPLRLVGVGQYQSVAYHRFTPLIGARITF